MNLERREKRTSHAVNTGLVANVFLAGIKTVIGITGRSPALLAEGINSTSDVAYYVVSIVFMRLASKPADQEHPYGHRQLESIAALVVGSFIITTAVAVFWDAINKVYELLMGKADYSGATLAALWVAVFTVGLKFFLTYYTQRVGRQIDNPMIMAMAFDHRNDIFSASAAVIGIFLGQRGYPWVDPLAGALVAVVILRTGIEILRESSIDLMDTVPSVQLEQQIKRLLKNVPGVVRVEEMQAHRFGPYLVVNLTIGVDGTLSVAQGDAIASNVEETLYRNIDLLRRVHVHYHPFTLTLSPAEFIKDYIEPAK
jgi:cation diffusion facilitator family transporter